MVRINVSKEIRRAKYWLMVKKMVKTNPAITLLSGLCNARLSGVPNNPCDLTRIPNIDEGVALVDNKWQTLQWQFFL